MSTVRRDFRASPHRTGCETWQAITSLLAPISTSSARKELNSVQGICGQIISTESLKDYPLIAAGSGPRVRVYCVYDDSALDEDTYNEAALAFDPTSKDWKVSLPVEDDDLEWSKAELSMISKRITVRKKAASFEEEDQEKEGTGSNSASGLTLDISKFLKQ